MTDIRAQVLKKTLKVLLALSIAACSTAPIRSDELNGSYASNIQKLDLNNSFAFILGSDEYYFSQVLLTEGNFKCRFFVGFKNEQFRFSFPAFRLSELSTIYYEKHTLARKKELAVKKIEGFEVEKQKCTQEIAEKQKTMSDYAEEAGYLLVFAPAIPLALVFGGEVWINGIKDAILENKMKHLRLGMSKAEVKTLLGRELVQNKTAYYEYDSLDYGSYQRIVLAFQDDKLTGLIRGFTDTHEHAR